MVIEKLLPFISDQAAAWVRAQRERHRPDGAPLDPELRERLAAYFAAETLDRAGVTEVDGIGDPPFYADLFRQGLTNLIVFRNMLGITFDDTIVIDRKKKPSGRAYDALLFHELVHVAQYQRLGIDRFLHHYVTSWYESGLRYEGIRLEKQAYALEGELTSSKEPFSVEERLDALMAGMR